MKVSSRASRPIGTNFAGSVTSSAASKNVGIAEHQQRSHGRVVDQLRLRLKDENTRALRAHERLRYMEALLRQERRQIEARDAARNHREFFADLVRVFVSQRLELTIDLTFSATLANDALESSSLVAPTVRRVPS